MSNLRHKRNNVCIKENAKNYLEHCFRQIYRPRPLIIFQKCTGKNVAFLTERYFANFSDPRNSTFLFFKTGSIFNGFCLTKYTGCYDILLLFTRVIPFLCSTLFYNFKRFFQFWVKSSNFGHFLNNKKATRWFNPFLTIIHVSNRGEVIINNFSFVVFYRDGIYLVNSFEGF